MKAYYNLKAPEANEIWEYPPTGDVYLIEGTDNNSVYTRNIIIMSDGTFIYKDFENTIKLNNVHMIRYLSLWGYLDENENVAVWPWVTSR